MTARSPVADNPFASIPDNAPAEQADSNPFAHIPDDSTKAPKADDPFASAGPPPTDHNPFAHIPDDGAIPVAAKPSEKTYWDAGRKVFTDIWGDVKEGYGKKNAWELMKTESLPAHLYQGVSRMAKGAPQPEDKSSPTMVESLKQLGVTAKEHPGLLVGSLVRSLVSDPELLVPWLWEAIPGATAAKVALAAREMGATANMAQIMAGAARVGASAGVGAVANLALEGGAEFAQGQAKPGELGAAALEGGVLGAVVGGVKAAKGTKVPEKPLLRDRTLPVVRETVTDALPPLTSPEAETYGLWKAVGENPHERPTPPKGLPSPKAKPDTLAAKTAQVIKQSAIGGAIGAGVGYAFDKKYGKPGKDDDVLGGGWKAGLTLGAIIPLAKGFKYKGEDISEAVNARNGQEAVVTRQIHQFVSQIAEWVPDQGRREALAEMIDRGVEPARMVGQDLRTVNPGEMSNEYKAYQALKQFFAHMHAAASEAGVIHGWRDNYISHIVVESKKKGTFLSELLGSNDAVKGDRPSGKQFNKSRRYETFEELNAAIKDSGLELKTKDAAEIARIYASSVYKSIADKRLLTALQNTLGADGVPLVMQVSKLVPKINEATKRAEVITIPNHEVPSSYKFSTNRQLNPYALHPDIAGDMGFVFSSHNPGWVRAKLEVVVQAAKRAVVFSSLFHAKTLFENFITQNLLDPRNPRLLSPKAALEMYKRGGNNDSLDTLLANGLKVAVPEDVLRAEHARGIDRVGDVLNATLPLKGFGVGALAKGLAKVERANERFTFTHLQTGFKISTALTEYARQIEMGVDKARAAKNAASFANDLYGGLDYYRVATDTTSFLFRKIGTSTLNVNSRKILQLAMFAPDWTMATFRTAAKAMPGGVDDAFLGQIHRRYMIKSAIYYLGFMNLVNYMNTGHSIFSNANPLRIELGNGQTVQASKHETEPLAWLQDPVGTAINKGSFVVHAFAEHHREASYAEFMHRPPPSIWEDAKNVAQGELPIPFQQVPIAVHEFIQNGMDAKTAGDLLVGVVGGELGFPVYGKTAAEKAQEKEARRKERVEKAHEKLYGEAAP